MASSQLISFPDKTSYQHVLDEQGRLLGMTLQIGNRQVGPGYTLRRIQLPSGNKQGDELAQPKAKPKGGDPQVIVNSIAMKLVLVPSGEFDMGSPLDEEGRDAVEEQHRVSISKPFSIGMYEATQFEYERVAGSNPSSFDDDDRRPVEHVTWKDAVEFCRRLSALPAEVQAGRVYRLPTAEEWEYACRAGTTTAFHFGNSLSSRQANFRGDRPYGNAPEGPNLRTTAPVGAYLPNEFGLYDVHGNVREWCAGDSGQPHRVVRGGSVGLPGYRCRSAWRNLRGPTFKDDYTGFRVVISYNKPTNALPQATTLGPSVE